MEKFSINPENFDLELTLTCGQTFCWNRINGELYGEGKPEFYTFRSGKPIIVEDKGDIIEVQTSHTKKEVKKALGMDKDLNKIFSSFPEDKILEKAEQKLWGLRIVQDDFFPCLISYLCSPQMRIPRIKKMHNKIAEKYGEKTEINGSTAYKFPTPKQLSKASEEDLRELGVGYRAKYIHKSTKIILENFGPQELSKMNYEEALEEMKELYGVGNKVGDCVLLFSAGFYEATPLDTWAQQVIQKHYPKLHSDKYQECSKNIRNQYGEYSGYALEYLFHAGRQGIIDL